MSADVRGTLVALVSALFLLAAPAFSEEPPAVVAYHKLTSHEVEAKPATTPPDADKLERIDVSEQVRSASFGHKTTLLVDGDRFYVEYGRSTNRPKRLYGPFPVGTPTTGHRR